MARATAHGIPSPIQVKRLPWMRRIQFVSPKQARMITLFSYQSLDAWALIESSALITHFCEHPGYVRVDGRRVLADFYLQGPGRREFVLLDEGIRLEPEEPSKVPTYDNVAISRVAPDWFDPYRQWIDNWLQINPYLVANARYVAPAALDRARGVMVEARTLSEAENALREMDLQLVRTAIFMLLHRGELVSDDLMLRPLSGSTLFHPNTTRS